MGTSQTRYTAEFRAEAVKQVVTISINDAAPISGVSTVTREQSDVLAALKVKKPTEDQQIRLL